MQNGSPLYLQDEFYNTPFVHTFHDHEAVPPIINKRSRTVPNHPTFVDMKHEQPLTLYCYYCGFSAKKKTVIRQHVVNCMENHLFKCNQFGPPVFTTYYFHTKNENQNDSGDMKQEIPCLSLYCYYFGFSAKKKAVIRQHVVNCMENHSVSCNQFGPPVFNADYFHQQKHHQNDSGDMKQEKPCLSLYCYYCGFSANEKTVIRRHVVNCMENNSVSCNQFGPTVFNTDYFHQQKENQNDSAKKKPVIRQHVGNCMENDLFNCNQFSPPVFTTDYFHQQNENQNYSVITVFLMDSQQTTKKRKSHYVCFVPGCKTTSENCPKKSFFFAPRKNPERQKWITACRRDESKHKLSPSYHFQVCEDHFDIEADLENHMRYKWYKENGFIVKAKLKPGVLPHKFDCQPTRRKNHQGAQSQRNRNGKP